MCKALETHFYTIATLLLALQNIAIRLITQKKHIVNGKYASLNIILTFSLDELIYRCLNKNLMYLINPDSKLV